MATNMAKGLRAIFCDSLEVAGYNAYWSDDFLAEFQKLRGYDLTPYLPLFKHPGYERFPIQLSLAAAVRCAGSRCAHPA